MSLPSRMTQGLQALGRGRPQALSDEQHSKAQVARLPEPRQRHVHRCELALRFNAGVFDQLAPACALFFHEGVERGGGFLRE